MSDDLSPDPTLAEAIERLKHDHPKTRELYREACALLFFRFGITPTANRLYQLIKRGSMSTPTEVLAEFWNELRKRSRVRLDRPDLPADLQTAAGDLVVALWEKSTADAQEALEVQRGELEVERAAGRQEVAIAQDAMRRATATLAERDAALLGAQTRIRELEQALAVSEAARRTLDADIAVLRHESREQDAALAQARSDFAQQLDKLRDDTQRAEERLRAAEKHALLEIERERGATARLQKDLEAAARKTEQHDERHRAEMDSVRTQLGDARHQVGVLQGRLDAMTTTCGTYTQEIDNLRRRLAAAIAATPVRIRAARRAGVGTTGPAIAPMLRKRDRKEPSE